MRTLQNDPPQNDLAPPSQLQEQASRHFEALGRLLEKAALSSAVADLTARQDPWNVSQLAPSIIPDRAADDALRADMAQGLVGRAVLRASVSETLLSLMYDEQAGEDSLRLVRDIRLKSLGHGAPITMQASALDIDLVHVGMSIDITKSSPSAQAAFVAICPVSSLDCMITAHARMRAEARLAHIVTPEVRSFAATLIAYAMTTGETLINFDPSDGETGGGGGAQRDVAGDTADKAASNDAKRAAETKAWKHRVLEVATNIDHIIETAGLVFDQALISNWIVWNSNTRAK